MQANNVHFSQNVRKDNMLLWNSWYRFVENTFCFAHTSSLHWNAAEVQYFDLVWRQTKFLYEYECIRSSQHSSRTLEAFTFFIKRVALSCVCSTWCFRRWRSNSTGLKLRNFETCEVVQHFIARSYRCLTWAFKRREFSTLNAIFTATSFQPYRVNYVFIR